MAPTVQWPVLDTPVTNTTHGGTYTQIPAPAQPMKFIETAITCKQTVNVIFDRTVPLTSVGTPPPGNRFFLLNRVESPTFSI